MQITNIEINNVLGIKDASIAIAKPALLIAGANGAGKSSIAEAVRHALTTECERVAHKKDFGRLLHNDASAGHAIISTTLGDYGVLLPDGKQTGDVASLPFELEFCLNPARFASANENERRAFLLKLMGVKITPSAIADKLAERGVAAEDIAQIKPHLASGFEAAHKEAQSLARDFKASWRAVTGETYGAVKAESWSAAKDNSLNDNQVINADKKTADADANIEQLSAQLGELNAKLGNAAAINQALDKREAKLAGLRQAAGAFARVQDKLNRDEKELAEWDKKVTETRQKANGNIHTPLTCPHCACLVVLGGDGNKDELIAYNDEHGQADQEAAAKLPEYVKAFDLMHSAVNNGKRDLLAAENAARELAELEKEAAAPLVDTEALQAQIDNCKGLLGGAKANRDLYRKDADSIKSILAANAQADQKTATAAAHHANVKAFEFCADCLAPSGIPSEMLNSALVPFNGHLQALSAIAEWPQVYITDDMSVVMGDRLYSLRSESERWRADAIIALAIAQISGINTVILDRFDVLDLKGRSDALYLIENLREGCTTILLGTLKSIPAQLPACMQAVWVENGIAKSKQEEAA